MAARGASVVECWGEGSLPVVGRLPQAVAVRNASTVTVPLMTRRLDEPDPLEGVFAVSVCARLFMCLSAFRIVGVVARSP